MANYTDYLSQAQGIFGDPNAKSPLSSYLENQGISAGKRAGQGAIAGLAKSGFGGSTFAQPISQQASTIAQQPYIQQATQTQQQDSQQRWQNIMNSIGQMQTQQKMNADAEAEKKKQEQALWMSLLNGGLSAATGGLSSLGSGVYNFLNPTINRASNVPSSTASGYLSGYKPSYYGNGGGL